MGCGPSVHAPPPTDQANPQPSPKAAAAVLSPSADAAVPARRLSAKSKPFWQLEQERKAKKQGESMNTPSDASSERTASPSGSSVADDSSSGRHSPTLEAGSGGSAAGLLCTALSGLVAPASTLVELSPPPSMPAQPEAELKMETASLDASTSSAEPELVAGAAFCSIGGGCGCGSDEPEAPIDPVDWIAGIEDPVARDTERKWLSMLSEPQFRVLRMKGTEEIHTGELEDHFAKAGKYHCAACDTPLYDAPHKFKSGHGWPAFSDNLPGALTRTEHGRNRKIEITCSGCDGHVGHVFKSKRYPAPTHERHCVNSISLKFVPPEADP
jgi:peptide-methionine (R)-S-oxide reductase